MNFEYEFTQSSWTAIDGLIRMFEKIGIIYGNIHGDGRPPDNMKCIHLTMLHSMCTCFLTMCLRRFTNMKHCLQDLKPLPHMTNVAVPCASAGE